MLSSFRQKLRLNYIAFLKNDVFYEKYLAKRRVGGSRFVKRDIVMENKLFLFSQKPRFLPKVLCKKLSRGETFCWRGYSKGKHKSQRI